MAKIPPNKVPTNNAGRAGTFFIMSNSTITGTKNNHGLMLKLLSIAINKFVISLEFCVLSIESPINKKMRSDMTKLGIVVYIMYLIWVNKFVPAIAGARFVVSDKGDILSPKYAPDIIAPAVRPFEISKALPIPNRAIPTVAIVDQELPEANETIAHMMAAATRKIFGFSICNP